MPHWAIEEWADEWTQPDKINTNGPYLLAENIEGERIQLIKNSFWVNADKVQIEVITELYGYDQNVIDMYRNNKPDTIGQGYDPDLARTLFAAYLKDGGFTIEEFNTAYPLVVVVDDRAIELAVTDWQRVLGITVLTETISSEEFTTRQNPNAPLDKIFPIYWDYWCADYPDQNNFLFEVFNSVHGQNWTRRNCAEENCKEFIGPNDFDRLTLQAAHSLDPNERMALYAQAEQILAVDEAAYAPLFHEAAVSLNKPWLTRNYPATLIPDFENWCIDVYWSKTINHD